MKRYLMTAAVALVLVMAPEAFAQVGGGVGSLGAGAMGTGTSMGAGATPTITGPSVAAGVNGAANAGVGGVDR